MVKKKKKSAGGLLSVEIVLWGVGVLGLHHVRSAGTHRIGRCVWKGFRCLEAVYLIGPKTFLIIYGDYIYMSLFMLCCEMP